MHAFKFAAFSFRHIADASMLKLLLSISTILAHIHSRPRKYM